MNGNSRLQNFMFYINRRRFYKVNMNLVEQLNVTLSPNEIFIYLNPQRTPQGHK